MRFCQESPNVSSADCTRTLSVSVSITAERSRVPADAVVADGPQSTRPFGWGDLARLSTGPSQRGPTESESMRAVRPWPMSTRVPTIDPHLLVAERTGPHVEPQHRRVVDPHSNRRGVHDPDHARERVVVVDLRQPAERREVVFTHEIRRRLSHIERRDRAAFQRRATRVSATVSGFGAAIVPDVIAVLDATWPRSGRRSRARTHSTDRTAISGAHSLLSRRSQIVPRSTLSAGRSPETTCPQPWTPASVRPDIEYSNGRRLTRSTAAASSPITVRTPWLAAQARGTRCRRYATTNRARRNAPGSGFGSSAAPDISQETRWTRRSRSATTDIPLVLV